MLNSTAKILGLAAVFLSSCLAYGALAFAGNPPEGETAVKAGAALDSAGQPIDKPPVAQPSIAVPEAAAAAVPSASPTPTPAKGSTEKAAKELSKTNNDAGASANIEGDTKHP